MHLNKIYDSFIFLWETEFSQHFSFEHLITHSLESVLVVFPASWGKCLLKENECLRQFLNILRSFYISAFELNEEFQDKLC